VRVGGEIPEGVAGQFERADGLLDQLEAAEMRVGRGQQTGEWMIGNFEAARRGGAENPKWNERRRLGNAIDGDIAMGTVDKP